MTMKQRDEKAALSTSSVASPLVTLFFIKEEFYQKDYRERRIQFRVKGRGENKFVFPGATS